MKEFFNKSMFLTLLLPVFIASCITPSSANDEALEEVKADMVDAKAVLEQAEFDSMNDFNSYKESILLKLFNNQSVLNDLKKDSKAKDSLTRELDMVEIKRLEKINSKLKYKIENYEQDTAEKLEMFKVDFSYELDDLRNCISSLVEDKV